MLTAYAGNEYETGSGTLQAIAYPYVSNSTECSMISKVRNEAAHRFHFAPCLLYQEEDYHESYLLLIVVSFLNFRMSEYKQNGAFISFRSCTEICADGG